MDGGPSVLNRIPNRDQLLKSARAEPYIEARIITNIISKSVENISYYSCMRTIWDHDMPGI